MDVLIGVHNQDMYFSMLHFQGVEGGLGTRLDVLGWTCIGPPE